MVILVLHAWGALELYCSLDIVWINFVINNLNWICTWRIICWKWCFAMFVIVIVSVLLYVFVLCPLFQLNKDFLHPSMTSPPIHEWMISPALTFIQRGVSMGVCLKLDQELNGGKMNWRGRLTGLGRPECREESIEGFTQDFETWTWNSLF